MCRSKMRPLALALEQGVRRDGGTHPNGLDLAGVDGAPVAQAQQGPDAGDRGIVVQLRVLREQLVRDQAAVRPPGDHVRERAATVDPELPALPRHAGLPSPLSVHSMIARPPGDVS